MDLPGVCRGTPGQNCHENSGIILTLIPDALGWRLKTPSNQLIINDLFLFLGAGWASGLPVLWWISYRLISLPSGTFR
jgi:hypothetical protein